jgi:hypothetical protein
VLVVRWVDRLGRDYEDVCDVIREFMRRGVVIRTIVRDFTFDGLTKDPMKCWAASGGHRANRQTHEADPADDLPHQGRPRWREGRFGSLGIVGLPTHPIVRGTIGTEGPVLKSQQDSPPPVRHLGRVRAPTWLRWHPLKLLESR